MENFWWENNNMFASLCSEQINRNLTKCHILSNKQIFLSVLFISWSAATMWHDMLDESTNTHPYNSVSDMGNLFMVQWRYKIGCVFYPYFGLESTFLNMFPANLYGDKHKPVFKRL